jgi:hypothetical protein
MGGRILDDELKDHFGLGIVGTLAETARIHILAEHQEYDPDFSCVHRGPALRQEKCRLCGNRDKLVDVLACGIRGECTIHAHGIPGKSGRLAVCIACDQIKRP